MSFFDELDYKTMENEYLWRKGILDMMNRDFPDVQGWMQTGYGSAIDSTNAALGNQINTLSMVPGMSYNTLANGYNLAQMGLMGAPGSAYMGPTYGYPGPGYGMMPTYQQALGGYQPMMPTYQQSYPQAYQPPSYQQSSYQAPVQQSPTSGLGGSYSPTVSQPGTTQQQSVTPADSAGSIYNYAGASPDIWRDIAGFVLQNVGNEDPNNPDLASGASVWNQLGDLFGMSPEQARQTIFDNAATAPIYGDRFNGDDAAREQYLRERAVWMDELAGTIGVDNPLLQSGNTYAQEYAANPQEYLSWQPNTGTMADIRDTLVPQYLQTQDPAVAAQIAQIAGQRGISPSMLAGLTGGAFNEQQAADFLAANPYQPTGQFNINQPGSQNSLAGQNTTLAGQNSLAGHSPNPQFSGASFSPQTGLSGVPQSPGTQAPQQQALTAPQQFIGGSQTNPATQASTGGAQWPWQGGQTYGSATPGTGLTGSNSTLNATLNSANMNLANAGIAGVGAIGSGAMQGRGDLMGMTSLGLGGLQPYQQGGNLATAQMQALTGLRGNDAQSAAIQNVLASPEFDFYRSEGEGGVLRNAAALGGLGGGNVMKELSRFNQGLASTQFQNYYDRLSPMAGMGLQASGAAADLAGRTGSTAANLGLGMGTAQGGLIADTGRLQSGNTMNAGGMMAGNQMDIGRMLSGMAWGGANTLAGQYPGLATTATGAYGNQGAQLANLYTGLAGALAGNSWNRANIAAGFGGYSGPATNPGWGTQVMGGLGTAAGAYYGSGGTGIPFF